MPNVLLLTTPIFYLPRFRHPQKGCSIEFEVANLDPTTNSETANTKFSQI